MADKRDYSKVKIIHKMADGSIRNSLEGYKVNVETFPRAAKEIIRQIITGEFERTE